MLKKKKEVSLSSIFYCRRRTERDIHASGEESRFDAIKRWSEKKASMPCHAMGSLIVGKVKGIETQRAFFFFFFNWFTL